MNLTSSYDVEKTVKRAVRRAALIAEHGQLRLGRHSKELMRLVRREPEPTPWIRATVSGALVGVGAGLALTAAASAVAGHFARVVVTPVKEKVEDLDILAVVEGEDGDEVILPATAETVVDGTYGLFFHRSSGFARIGKITSFSPRDGTLAREVQYVDGGDLRTAARGWWSAAPYRTPEEMGYTSTEVQIQAPGGPAPAWHIPAPIGKSPSPRRKVWAIMIHGRGGLRTEGIKALPVAQDLGMDALLISYRNDGEAAAAPDGRYGLGVTEWADVEAAMQYALDQGADDLVLFAWSMGGAIALQAVDRSPMASTVNGLVLTGPVIDWIHVLAHQARALRLPEPVARLTRWLISHEAGRRITGLASPVDLKAMNWIDRADQLRHRTLILHSIDDPVVPYGPSRDLAQQHDLVSFVPFNRARHVKEWNYQPQRWERHVTTWLTDLFSQETPGAHPQG